MGEKQIKVMISYSVDSTIFIPPKIYNPENDKQLTQLKDDVENFGLTIDKCYNLLISQENISVYLFNNIKIIKNYIYFDYKNAQKYIPYLSMDATNQKLDNILELRFVERECHLGINLKDVKQKNKYDFEDWFNIKNIKKNNCILTPSINNLITQDNDLESKIIMIGILNQYIYKNSDCHFLVMNGNDTTIFVQSSIKFTILNVNNEKLLNINNNDLLKTQVKTKNIKNITIKPKTFNTVLEAYEEAKKQFSNYLIFGKDVDKGIETLKKHSGPPDRIFTYLETLKDFCEYKRNNNTPNDKFDIEILRVFGCICTGEDYINPKNKKYREYDNGSGNKEEFKIHLKPNTYDPVPPGKTDRTVRIYLKWEEIQKKVIIGWIGCHPHSYRYK